MAYSIKLDIKQNDYNRYITHSAFYDIEKLNTCLTFIKAELKNRMAFLGELKGDVYLEVLKSDEYQVNIVFDLNTKDVYFSTNHFDKYNSWTAITMFGDKNTNHINLTTINNDEFDRLINKPTKLLILMFYKDISKCLDDCSNELVTGNKLFNKIIDELDKLLKNPTPIETTEDTTKESTSTEENKGE